MFSKKGKNGFDIPPCTKSTFLYFNVICFEEILQWEVKGGRDSSPHGAHLPGYIHLSLSVCFFLSQGQKETVTLTSHFDASPTTKWHFILTFPLPVISTRSNKTRRNSEVRRSSQLLFKCCFFFCPFFPLHDFRLDSFCQETLSINWTSLPCIQGINFITGMGGRSLFLLSLRIDGNEMEVTPALLQWFWQFSDLFFFFLQKRKNEYQPTSTHCGFRQRQVQRAVTGNHIHYTLLLLKCLTLRHIISPKSQHWAQGTLCNYGSRGCV